MYEAYFNLKERPFSISPDPRFFYLTAQHKEALTNCQYMITNRVGPVYVHGDVGTGKTTIARRLYQQLLDDPHYILAMIISPNLKSSNALLRLIMKEFNVKTDKKYENFGDCSESTGLPPEDVYRKVRVRTFEPGGQHDVRSRRVPTRPQRRDHRTRRPATARDRPLQSQRPPATVPALWSLGLSGQAVSSDTA
jgi:AAA domain-containing protein